MALRISRTACQFLKGHHQVHQSARCFTGLSTQFNVVETPNKSDWKLIDNKNDSPLTRVLIAVKAGSRNESRANRGLSHLLRHGIKLRSAYEKDMTVTNALEVVGGMLNTTTGREHALISYSGSRAFGVNVIQKVLHAVFKNGINEVDWRLAGQLKANMDYDLALLQQRPDIRLIDNLHSAAYRDTLGNSLYAPENFTGSYSIDQVEKFIRDHYQSSRVAIVTSGLDSAMRHQLQKFLDNMRPIEVQSEITLQEELEDGKLYKQYVKRMLQQGEKRDEKTDQQLENSWIELERQKLLKNGQGLPDEKLLAEEVRSKIKKLEKEERQEFEEARLAEANLKLERAEANLQEALENIGPHEEPAKYVGGEHREALPNADITYAAIATEGLTLTDKDALALSLLQNVLGLESRIKYSTNPTLLNSAIEKAVGNTGFSAYALNANYSDSGLFGFALSASSKQFNTALRAAAGEFRRVLNEGITDADLHTGKARLTASMAMTLESVEARMVLQAEQALAGMPVTSPAETYKKINALTTSDVNRVAKKLLGGKLSMSAIGDMTQVPYLDEIEELTGDGTSKKKLELDGSKGSLPGSKESDISDTSKVAKKLFGDKLTMSREPNLDELKDLATGGTSQKGGKPDDK